MKTFDRKAVTYGIIGVLLGSAISFAVINHRLEQMEIQQLQPVARNAETMNESELNELIIYYEGQANELKKLKNQR
jgi:hypothetical protein